MWCQGVKPQRNGAVFPERIILLDQRHLPSPSPILQLLFTSDRGVHVIEHLEVDEAPHAVLRREALEGSGPMLMDAGDEIGRDADIKSCRCVGSRGCTRKAAGTFPHAAVFMDAESSSA